jgi:hypothetical protein
MKIQKLILCFQSFEITVGERTVVVKVSVNGKIVQLSHWYGPIYV